MAHSDPLPRDPLRRDPLPRDRVDGDPGLGRCRGGTSFIGSFLDDPGQAAVIVLRGDIDAAAVGRLAVHIDGVLGAGARFLSIDAGAVAGYHPDLLELLGPTQHRLGRRRGLLQVRGLHPSLLWPCAGTVAGSRPDLRPVPEPAP